VSVSAFVFLNLCIIERDKLTSTTKESSRVKILCQDFESGSMVKTQYQRSLTATRLSYYCRLYLVTLVQKIENAIATPKWVATYAWNCKTLHGSIIGNLFISCFLHSSTSTVHKFTSRSYSVLSELDVGHERQVTVLKYLKWSVSSP